MPLPVDPALMSVLTGSGVCGVVVVLMILRILVPGSVASDLKEENADLKAQISEKDAVIAALAAGSGASVTAAQSVRDILAAIQFGHDLTSGHQLPAVPQPPEGAHQ